MIKSHNVIVDDKWRVKKKKGLIDATHPTKLLDKQKLAHCLSNTCSQWCYAISNKWNFCTRYPGMSSSRHLFLSTVEKWNIYLSISVEIKVWYDNCLYILIYPRVYVGVSMRSLKRSISWGKTPNSTKTTYYRVKLFYY